MVQRINSHPYGLTNRAPTHSTPEAQSATTDGAETGSTGSLTASSGHLGHNHCADAASAVTISTANPASTPPCVLTHNANRTGKGNPHRHRPCVIWRSSQNSIDKPSAVKICGRGAKP